MLELSFKCFQAVVDSIWNIGQLGSGFIIIAIVGNSLLFNQLIFLLISD